MKMTGDALGVGISVRNEQKSLPKTFFIFSLVKGTNSI
jgi:hypothetical protein